MTKEKFKVLKESYLELVIKMITESGGLSPSFTVLGTEISTGKNAICLVVIDPKYMKDDTSKDVFIDRVVPQIAEEVRQKIDIDAIGWSCEAWMRIADAKTIDTDKEIGDWKSIPIKAEILIVSVDSEDYKETFIKEIIRTGKQVNEDGHLVDVIELKDMPGYEDTPMHAATGRFTDLYKKFTKKL